MSGCVCWGWLWLLWVSERTRGLLLGRVRVTHFRSLEPPSRLQDSCYDSWHFWPLWWFCDALVVDLLLVPWILDSIRRRGGWLLLSSFRSLTQGSTLVASVSHLDDGFVYIQGIQIALCDTLELITGWVSELVPARDNNAFVGGS